MVGVVPMVRLAYHDLTYRLLTVSLQSRPEIRLDIKD